MSRIWQGAVVASMVLAPAALAKVTIYMCGDSTMQDWAEGYYPKQGQGQDFHYWFDVNLAGVVNRGQGGMAADGYYDMFWKHGCSAGNCIVDKLQAGDYVVIQFGINDVSKSDEAKFTAAYGAMVRETLAKNAYPIIMSPIRRCIYDSPTAIHNSYRGYPVRAKTIADSLKVPFIDMSEEVANFMISVGERYAQQFIFNYATSDEYSNLGSDQADQVHLQMNGANAFGRIITEQMRAHKDPVVKKLGDYMAPMYMVNVKVSPADAAEATSISAYYPKGMTVMLKTIPKTGKKFLGWYDGNGNKVGAPSRSDVKSPYIYTFTMGNASTQYTAVYEGGSAQKYDGDGAALKAFPTTTPKSLDDVTFIPFTPMDGSQESTVAIDKDTKKFFDAAHPDGFDGFEAEKTNAGFHGDGYFNFDNSNKSYGSYKMKFPGAGYTTLSIIYANGGTSDRMINAYLDHDYYISAPPTGGWTTWDTAYVVLDAPQGEAELKFMSLTNDGGPNIDMFGFSMDGVCRVGDCPAVNPVVSTPGDSSNSGQNTTVEGDSMLVVRGHMSELASKTLLSGDRLVLSHSGSVEIGVFDLMGRKVFSRVMPLPAGETRLPLKSWVKKNGIYRIVVRQGGEFISGSWVRNL